MIEMKGVYTLLIQVNKDQIIDTRNRSFAIKKGFYAYIGSAMGPHNKSIELRIERHLRNQKKNFWHIDYLLESESAIRGIVFSQSHERLECELAYRLNARWISVNQFGCSDCKCESHLFLRKYRMNFEKSVSEIKKLYKELGLHAEFIEYHE